MDIEFLNSLGIGEENAALILEQNNSEISSLNVRHTVENELRKRGVKNMNVAMQLFNADELQLSDGKIEGFEEKMNSFINENEFLFEATNKPVFSAPAGKTSKNEITQEEFSRMGYANRLKLFNENPHIYKALTNN